MNALTETTCESIQYTTMTTTVDKITSLYNNTSNLSYLITSAACLLIKNIYNN